MSNKTDANIYQNRRWKKMINEEETYAVSIPRITARVALNAAQG